MFFELQDDDARKAACDLHARMIKAALVEIFQFPTGRAQARVQELFHRYDGAPTRERDFFLHEDPVTLVAQIAGQDPQRHPILLKRFNNEIRPRFVEEASRQDEVNMKPTLEKLGITDP
jgi:hypothetical protein